MDVYINIIEKGWKKMNGYDTANRLAQELKNSEEYINYKMAKEA